MAAAQTYIISENDGIYSYENIGHYNNHLEHLEKFYNISNLNEFLPIRYTSDNNCVIDIARHDFLGTIYLPETMTAFQKQWILERENYFKRIKWHMLSDGINIDDISFDVISNKIKMKKLNEKKEFKK